MRYIKFITNANTSDNWDCLFTVLQQHEVLKCYNSWEESTDTNDKLGMLNDNQTLK